MITGRASAPCFGGLSFFDFVLFPMRFYPAAEFFKSFHAQLLFQQGLIFNNLKNSF